MFTTGVIESKIFSFRAEIIRGFWKERENIKINLELPFWDIA